MREKKKKNSESAMRVDWLLTGGLSCWLGTPLLSDGANGFIVKKCSPGLNLTSRSCPTPHRGLPSPSPPSTPPSRRQQAAA